MANRDAIYIKAVEKEGVAARRTIMVLSVWETDNSLPFQIKCVLVNSPHLDVKAYAHAYSQVYASESIWATANLHTSGERKGRSIRHDFSPETLQKQEMVPRWVV